MGEQYLTTCMLFAAAVLQLAAAGVALLLALGDRKHRAWALVTIALLVQAWRRLYYMFAGSSSALHEATTALIVSAMLLVGVILINALTRSLRRNAEALGSAQAEAELFLDVTGAAIVVMDPGGQFLQINQKGRQIFGLEEEHIDVGEWFSTLPPEEMREELREGFQAFMNGEYGDDMYLEYPIVTGHGDERDIYWHRHIVRDDGGSVVGYVSAGIDMTHRRHAERDAAFRSMLLDQTSDAILVTELDGRIVYANDAACAMARRPRERLLRTNVRDFLTTEWVDVLEERSRQLRHAGSILAEFAANVGGPEPLPIEVHSHLIDAKGRELVVSVLRDLTERKRAEATIRHMAYHDSLTGLPNRALFQDRAEMAIARARRHEEKLTILFLDVDGLKLVNDSFGHAVADGVLRRLASRLLDVLREEDTVARVGGDEFAIILPATDEEMAQVAANKVLRELHRPFDVYGKEIRPSVSIGVAIYPRDGQSLDDLLASSDTAMYEAKQRGGGSLSFFTNEMKERVLDVLRLRHDLGFGLERGEFLLHYQPQVNMATGEILGAEALLRWLHPEKGLLPPLTFVGLAEESGAIETIGGWVLEEACAQGMRWTDLGHGPLRVAVNVSARQFRNESFVDTVRETLDRTGLDAERLQLEITETVAMEDPEGAIETLQALRDIGVTVAIDDFGTGHSSMAYLKRFPLSATKIDRTFIGDVDSDKNSQYLVSTMITLATTLGLEVIAEGVERSEQVACLRALGCEKAQGFLYHPPVPADELIELLAANEVRFGAAEKRGATETDTSFATRPKNPDPDAATS
ncbi:MAG: EAL domain-containing protein [Coriobacteriia bacterium]|nr:EAL domain-containing protein [Coriobacteriia bacterium]